MRLTRHTNPRTKYLKHVRWSNPNMVDEIYEYIPNLHGNHTLCYFMNDCRIILKRKNPSEGTEWCQILQKARTANQLLPSDRCLVCEKTWIQENNMLKTLVKCVSKPAEEKLITMPPIGEITLERMTDTRKPSKTLKPLKSKLPTRTYRHYFLYIIQLCYRQNRL